MMDTIEHLLHAHTFLFGVICGLALGCAMIILQRYGWPWLYSRPRTLRVKRRMDMAVKKWNAEAERLFDHEFSDMEDQSKDAEVSLRFNWNQLMWQEIEMWIQLDKPVSQAEYDEMCQRRGFSRPQQRYLREMLGHVGLMDPVAR